MQVRTWSPSRACAHAVLVAVAFLALSASASAAADPWLDPSFGTNGGVRQSFTGDIGATVAGVAVAPGGDLILGLEPTNVKSGCCAADVGGWALARVAKDGTPRAGFGAGGVIAPAVSALPGTDGSVIAQGIAVDTSGRILITGRQRQPTGGDRPVVVRRLATGALDTSFATGGRMTLPTPAPCSPAQQPSMGGVIALAGGQAFVFASCQSDVSSVLIVARVTATGALDNSFATHGVETIGLPTIGSCCQIDPQRLPDGRIVIGLSSNPAGFVRLLATGLPDPSFGGGDGIATAATASGGGGRILALPDGRIVFDAGFHRVSRLTASGTIDAPYGDGLVPTPTPCAFPSIIDLAGTAAQTVVAVQCIEGVTLAAIDASGSPDAAYGTPAVIARSDTAADIFLPGRFLTADGTGMIVAGTDPQRGVVIERRLASGASDTSFGTGGSTHLAVRGRHFSVDGASSAVDSHGRLVTAVAIRSRRWSDGGAIAVSRFLANGAPDSTFGPGGTRLVEGSGFRPGQFAGEGEAIGQPRILLRPDDGVTVVADWVNEIRSYGPQIHESGLLVARLTPAGAPDASFAPGGARVVATPDRVDGSYGGIAPGAGDTILVAMAVSDAEGEHPAIVRLLASGDVDATYGAGGYARATDLAASGSSGVTIAGLPGGAALLSWHDEIAFEDRVVARVAPGGAFDATYAGTGRMHLVAAGNAVVSTTATGKALAAWSILRHPDEVADNSADIHVRRYLANGAIDTSFGTAGTTVLKSDARAGTIADDSLFGVTDAGGQTLVLLHRRRDVTTTTQLLRLSANGRLDAGFGTGGALVIETAALFVIGSSPGIAVGPTGTATIVRTSFGPRIESAQDLLATRVLSRIIRVIGPPATTTLTGRATFSWLATGIPGPYTVERRVAKAAGAFGPWQALPRGSSTKVTVTVARGTTLCVRVRSAGGVSSVPSCVTSPLAARSLRASAGWKTVHGASLYTRAGRQTRTIRASLKARVTARTLVLIASRCRTCGAVDVLWNGKRVAHVSLAGATKHRVAITVGRFAATATGTVTIRVTTRRRPVTIEGLAAWRDDAG